MHPFETKKDKRVAKTEAEKRRSIFINLRLKNAIKVDKPETLVDQPAIQCVICQRTFTVKELMSTLRCGHTFHANCLRESFDYNTEDWKQKCPMCEQIMVDLEQSGNGQFGNSSQHVSDNKRDDYGSLAHKGSIEIDKISDNFDEMVGTDEINKDEEAPEDNELNLTGDDL